MICDFNEQALDETAKLNLPDLAVCFCDVSDRSQVERLAEDTWQALGGVDLLFANAGVGVPLSPLLQQEDDHARWVFEVNFFRCMEHHSGIRTADALARHSMSFYGDRLREQYLCARTTTRCLQRK